MSDARVLFAGTKSGCGKTTAVCAVLALLKRRVRVKAFKCGPDYIDPMFHRTVSGVPCSNLDPFFCDGDMMRRLIGDGDGEDIAVIEGVMGYYDGTGEDGTDNSAYTVAEKTASPVILVVDAKGASASLIAQIEGFLRFVPDSHIVGVLFTRASRMSYLNLVRLMKDRFGEAVTPVGYIPELPDDCVFGSRRLGLVTAGEIADISARLEKIAGLCEKTVDIDAVLSIASTAGGLSFTTPSIPSFEPIKLAVAYDDAFCFYYHDTLRLLQKMGAEIIYFSPLADEPVPAEADGLLLGGGYPELHSETLEANLNSKTSIKKAVHDGMPTIAECGGYMYLGAELDGHMMCGALGHTSRDTGRLTRFGYITLTAKKDGLFGPAGTQLRAHEFHYWDSSDTSGAFRAVKPDGRSWDCGVLTDTLYAGYPHLYLSASVPAAESFYKKCLGYKEKKQ